MSNKSGDYERDLQEVSRWMLAGAVAGLVSFFGALFLPVRDNCGDRPK